ncbi:MAG: phenylacetate--CoA ligase family protein [Candidatus Thermoplasmatota archaeon]|nr:phenylacetate--CoA ligase family protein [Candidatus Thermoplasmatota archaeon]
MAFIPNPNFIRLYSKHTKTIDRLWKLNIEELKQFQTKKLHEMIDIALEVPVYKNKFQEAQINKETIQYIDDISKIPFTSKQNLRDFGRDGTLPKNFNLEKGFKVDTSGSTGKPVSIYRDLNAIALEMTTTARIMKSHHLPQKKTRISNIGDFTLANSYDEECIKKGVNDQLGFLNTLYSGRYQNLFTGRKISELMHDLNEFQPDMIIAYPGVLIGLMKLKKEGNGEQLSPSHIVYSGGVLDPYTKKQIEDTFDSHVLGLYTGTESGVIAFQCPHGNYHVQSDLVHIDAIDTNGKSVAPGEHGHVVVTRLYGGGTPIIRYTGMDDIITPKEGKCRCGMHSQLLENVEGRSVDSIIVPDGRIFPAATFTLIPGEVAQEKDVDIIHRFQVIQHKKDKIEILVVFNEDKKDQVSNVDTILQEIKKRYQKLIGEDVTIEIKEVDKVKEDTRSPVNLSSIVISHVDHKDWV